MPSKPRYFTYSSMAFFPLLSIRCLYSGNWYNTKTKKNLALAVHLYKIKIN
ncbi:hypothetical protein [Wolbachia endosymbiont (group B) of Gerris lacustris]|uniref:hypothetical protein n=1 Tax=Wolbachia endosymbiont (group B) of Gerris lacustris TaxID=3066159 RepID=UPI00333F33F8